MSRKERKERKERKVSLRRKNGFFGQYHFLVCKTLNHGKSYSCVMMKVSWLVSKIMVLRYRTANRSHGKFSSTKWVRISESPSDTWLSKYFLDKFFCKGILCLKRYYLRFIINLTPADLKLPFSKPATTSALNNMSKLLKP